LFLEDTWKERQERSLCPLMFVVAYEAKQGSGHCTGALWDTDAQWRAVEWTAVEANWPVSGLH